MGILYLEKLEDLEKDHHSNTSVLISLNLQGTLLISMPPFLCESHVLSLEVNVICLPRNPQRSGLIDRRKIMDLSRIGILLNRAILSDRWN